MIAFKRWNAEGNVVVVVANLTHQYAGGFEIGDAGLEDGQWREVLYDYETTVHGGRLADTLAESEAKIYVKA